MRRTVAPIVVPGQSASDQRPMAGSTVGGVGMSIVRVLRSTTAALLCAGLLALGGGTVEAQELVRVSGWVQWIAGNRMQVAPDGGGTVAIDLRDADQGSYQALRPGDRVVVVGVVARDRSRVMARDVLPGPQGFELQAP